MGDLSLQCPLCCNETFNSKQSLLKHLYKRCNSLMCPICNNQWSSLGHLIEHLSLDNCQPDIIIARTNLSDDENFEISCKTSDMKGNQIDNACDNNLDTAYSIIQSYDSPIVTSDVNKMYVELLSKQPGLQTQELKLVKENGDKERYVFISPGDDMLNKDLTVVTKQNNDGTISLTTVEDIKPETDGLFSIKDSPEESQEIYSCNTCKVSFSSVLEHIQNYHNDQDVVVEEPLEEDIPPSEYEALDDESLSNSDKQAARRVITDTGDIVEESIIFKSEILYQENDQKLESESEVSNKEGRAHSRRFVQVDNLCDSFVKPIQEDESNTTFHKVIVKDIQVENGKTEKRYNCMSCNITAPSIDDFKSHPCKKLKYPCPHPDCPVAYENSKSLCAHMKVHKSKTVGLAKPRVTYECEICWTIFPTNKSLKLHKRMHDPIKSRPIDPPVVNRDGNEGSEDRYLCNVCDKMIPIDYKAIHINSHKTNNKMNCSICNKKFTSVEYLEMHMNVHNLEKAPVNNQDKSLPYSCIYCNRRFARPHEKVKHERIHTGEKPHSCEICGKSFRVSYCLTLHMRTHTGARPYACPHCGKRFKAHSVFNHHLLTHSDVRAYKCPYCPKAFKTAVQLAGHKNSHTKPFSCQQCNRPFASLYAVRVHTETHARQNNLKFSCAMCGASYARAFALKDHVKQVHKQDMDSVDNAASQDDWLTKDEIMKDADTDGIQDLNKDLQNEISDLGMNANELIT